LLQYSFAGHGGATKSPKTIRFSKALRQFISAIQGINGWEAAYILPLAFASLWMKKA
jgi:hypothetical protein